MFIDKSPLNISTLIFNVTLDHSFYLKLVVMFQISLMISKLLKIHDIYHTPTF